MTASTYPDPSRHCYIGPSQVPVYAIQIAAGHDEQGTVTCISNSGNEVDAILITVELLSNIQTRLSRLCRSKKTLSWKALQVRA